MDSVKSYHLAAQTKMAYSWVRYNEVLLACKCLQWAYLRSCVIAGAFSIFSREDVVCLIFVSGSVSRNIISLNQYLPICVFLNMISADHVIQYHPCCQGISRNPSPHCNVYWQCKINTSLLMMREWSILHSSVQRSLVRYSPACRLLLMRDKRHQLQYIEPRCNASCWVIVIPVRW